MDFMPCTCSFCRDSAMLRNPPKPKGRAEVAHEKVSTDTEATMRRVMDKWLRGS